MIVKAPLSLVWKELNEPDSILQWDASPDRFTTSCTNEVRVAGPLQQAIQPRGEDA